MDPFLIGGGVLTLLLLLRGEKKEAAVLELTPAEREVVYSAPPEVVQQATQTVLQTTSIPPPPVSGQLAIKFVPDPSRGGLLTLQRKHPQLNLRYVRMDADPMTVIASTTDMVEAFRLIRQDPSVEVVVAA